MSFSGAVNLRRRERSREIALDDCRRKGRKEGRGERKKCNAERGSSRPSPRRSASPFSLALHGRLLSFPPSLSVLVLGKVWRRLPPLLTAHFAQRRFTRGARRRQRRFSSLLCKFPHLKKLPSWSGRPLRRRFREFRHLWDYLEDGK